MWLFDAVPSAVCLGSAVLSVGSSGTVAAANTLYIRCDVATISVVIRVQYSMCVHSLLLHMRCDMSSLLFVAWHITCSTVGCYLCVVLAVTFYLSQANDALVVCGTSLPLSNDVFVCSVCCILHSRL